MKKQTTRVAKLLTLLKTKKLDQWKVYDMSQMRRTVK